MSEENSASALIKQLNLAPHPEGGWYRETWRAPPVVPDPNDGTESARHNDARSAGTAILFLLKAGECSHWHKVDAQEIWLWHSGDPIEARGRTSLSALTLASKHRIPLGPHSQQRRLFSASCNR